MPLRAMHSDGVALNPHGVVFRSRDVVLVVLRNALTLTMVGLVLGLCGALALTRVVKNLLFQVSPVVPTTPAREIICSLCHGTKAANENRV